MNSAVIGRRKIERYAQLLDSANGGPRHHLRSPIDDELSDLVGLARHLGRAVDDVRPSDAFRAETRARLMAIAASEGIGVTAVKPESGDTRSLAKVREPRRQAPDRPGRTRIRVRGAILVGLAVGTLALSGMSAASGSAMPGDTLYGIKRSQEGAQLALTTSEAGKGKLYLEFARTRLLEAETIRSNPTLLKTTLADMDRETKQGVSLLISEAIAHRDSVPLTMIDQFVARQTPDIDTLLDEVGPDSRQLVLESSTTVGLAGIRSSDVRAVIACKTIPKRSADEFGPTVAAACAGAAQIDQRSPFQPQPMPPRTSYTNDSSTPENSHASTTVTSTTTLSTDAAADASTQSPGLLGDISHLLGGLLGR